ncbi:MAG: hypothetical protein DRJ32_05640 [Thermoprotei archaeon]|nr:MAG: hypothetical protein DRJ32_05640 [Thermoprotei archaeon]
MSEELSVWRSRITPTCRGAIFRAKRWFYATFYSKADEATREKSRENWTKLARALVEKSNEAGASEKAARLIIYYKTENGVFVPIKAEIEVYELKQVDKLEITPE